MELDGTRHSCSTSPRHEAREWCQALPHLSVCGVYMPYHRISGRGISMLRAVSGWTRICGEEKGEVG
jgi:hypothetical protein